MKTTKILLTSLPYILICILSGGCSPANNRHATGKAMAEEKQEEKSRGLAEPDGQPFHYVIQCTFTEKSLAFVSGVKEKGEAPLIVAPAGELFLAVYHEGALIHYFSFADPLETHAIAPQEGPQQQLKEGSGALLFPESLTGKYRSAALDIAIYSVEAYMPDFAANIRTAPALEGAVSEGKLSKKYPLDAGMLLAFLDALQ